MKAMVISVQHDMKCNFDDDLDAGSDSWMTATSLNCSMMDCHFNYSWIFPPGSAGGPPKENLGADDDTFGYLRTQIPVRI